MGSAVGSSAVSHSRQPVFPDFEPTVPALLRAGRERWPDNDCVVTPGTRLSYSELDARSASLAARLVGIGVGKGSRVGILFPNGEDWVIAWAAAARLGAVVIPVNTFYKAPELGRFLRHADVQVLLGVSRFLQHDYLERLESVSASLAAVSTSLAAVPTSLAAVPTSMAASRPLRLPELPQLRHVVLWDSTDRAWPVPLAALDAVAPALVAALEADVTPADELLVTYTSGSTGEPKGVVHGHGNAIRHARNLAALSGIDQSSRIWTPMPLCWVGGFAFTLLRAMSVGAAFLTQEMFEAGPALRFLSSARVTIVSAWPAACKAIASQPEFPTTDLSAMRGGALYDAIQLSLRPSDSSLVVGSLGMSETCGPHTFWTPEDERAGAPPEHRGTFGREVPGTEHRIIDPSTGADLPPGEEGEVLVRGYSLMLGMYKRERADVFDAEGWYHTGDRGYFRDGWFFFTGRQSDLIKTSGSNVAPAEVEACLATIPDVKLAFVVGVPHPDRGQDAVALVVGWDPLRPPQAEPIRVALREQLSSFKVPRHVFAIVDEDVPWLASQKADRRALGDLAARLVESWQTRASTA